MHSIQVQEILFPPQNLLPKVYAVRCCASIIMAEDFRRGPTLELEEVLSFVRHEVADSHLKSAGGAGYCSKFPSRSLFTSAVW